MIYRKLRQAGHAVNNKRAERLYQEATSTCGGAGERNSRQLKGSRYFARR
jgi:hypothetical protein